MKKALKSLSQKIAYWLGVVSIGLLVGLSLQFVRAWTEPAQAPPGGNVGAPINTSSNYQFKAGNVGVVNFSANGAVLTGSGAILQIPSGTINTQDVWLSSIGKWASSLGGGGSQWTTSGSNIYYGTGYVGIGTATPGLQLDVVGFARADYFMGRTGGFMYYDATNARWNFYNGGSFNGALSAPSVRATSTGYYFPDGTLQTTAASTTSLPEGHPGIGIGGAPVLGSYIYPSGNGWSILTHRGAYETLPGQYICGIQHKNNCDDYSSEDACISIKVCEGGAGGGGGSSTPVTCSWTGERSVPGNIGGCNDDLYVTCDGTKVTNMRWGC